MSSHQPCVPPPGEQISIPPQLIVALEKAERVVVLTGAGVSAESGVPTFRQAQTGLWERYRAEDLATPQAFQRNPRLVWEWYTWRRRLIRNAQPNPAHYALVELERRIQQFTLVTQNVDDLHRQAGSKKIIELHGNIFRTVCFLNRHPIEHWLEEDETLPRCPLCGSHLRPDVVWFGETLPVLALDEAWRAASNCQVFLSIGTSGLVQPAASLPYLALDQGSLLVEVNPDETPLSQRSDFVIRGQAGVVLPALVSAMCG
jgi:NAD-dependent deacetylase